MFVLCSQWWSLRRMQPQRSEKYPPLEERMDSRDKLAVRHPLSDCRLEGGCWPEVAISMTTPSWSESTPPILQRWRFRINQLMFFHCADNVKLFVFSLTAVCSCCSHQNKFIKQQLFKFIPFSFLLDMCLIIIGSLCRAPPVLQGSPCRGRGVGI